MKLNKNKSSIYVFPKIYDTLRKEGVNKNIMNHIYDTYLSDSEENFVIIINKTNTITNKKIGKKVLDSLYACDSIMKTDDISDELVVVKVKIDKDIDTLVEKFVKGEYSLIEDSIKSEILDFNFDHCSINQYIKIGYVLFKNKNYRKFLAEELNVPLKDIPEDSELDSKINLSEELYDSSAAEEIEKSYTEIQQS